MTKTVIAYLIATIILFGVFVAPTSVACMCDVKRPEMVGFMCLTAFSITVLGNLIKETL